MTEINTEINPSSRCASIHELFNDTIIHQPPLRRVKNYQQPCLKPHRGEWLKCFYDEKLMCLCDKNRRADCFNFETTPPQCPESACNSRGMCVQDHEKCSKASVCICDACSYGTNCQLTRAGYSISLDAIIGSHILSTAASILQQSAVIKITVTMLSLLIIVGVIFNVLSIGTFYRPETQQSGSGIYLFVSSCIGLLTMIALMCKSIIILSTIESNFSCSILEFLLKWLPTSCEWLNACVAIERTWVVVYLSRYSRSASKRLTKWIVGCVLICLAVVCVPELIFRRMVIDEFDEQAWCVLTLNADRPTHLKLYSVFNILSFALPLTINLICSILIIRGTFLAYQKTLPGNINDIINDNTSIKRWVDGIKVQIKKHKHILIAPILLGILAVPRLVFASIFVCTKIDRQPYLSLVAFCAAFLPSSAILVAFILPSQVYRAALLKFVKQIQPRFMQNISLDG